MFQAVCDDKLHGYRNIIHATLITKANLKIVHGFAYRFLNVSFDCIIIALAPKFTTHASLWLSSVYLNTLTISYHESSLCVTIEFVREELVDWWLNHQLEETVKEHVNSFNELLSLFCWIVEHIKVSVVNDLGSRCREVNDEAGRHQAQLV